MTTPLPHTPLSPCSRTGRAVEFTALFVIAPLAQLAWFETLGVFGPIALVCVVAAVLLHHTAGWQWRELWTLSGLSHWARPAAGFLAVSAAVIAGLVIFLHPERLLTLPRDQTALWIAIMLFYPILSVIGQELVFRPLFFRRYGALFPAAPAAVLANALVFALAHAFYQNWVALTLTFFGGLAFAEAYRRTGSFPLVVLIHAGAGQLIFTLGLGHYFYHGAVGA